MEIIPNTKFALKKMLKKYLVVYLVALIFTFVSFYIFCKSSIIFLVENINEILFSNSLISQYMHKVTVETILNIFAWPMLLPISLFFLEFYYFKTNKIKITLDNNGINTYYVKLLKTTTWGEYSDIITTMIPYKIKRGQKNKLVISNLFNKKIIEDTINNYKKSNNISINNF